MKNITRIICTTHLDQHKEMLAFSALESVIEQVKLCWIPVGVEHDPRIPPVGRIASAKIQELGDGEYAVEAVIDLFDEGETIELHEDVRQIPIGSHCAEKLDISYDRNFRDADDLAMINEIGRFFGTEPREEAKKALEPLTVLTVGGAFVLYGIARGFFGKLGADGYDFLKERLKQLMNREKQEEREKLLRFQALIEIDNSEIQVDVVMTNPTPKEIDDFFQSGITELDRVLPHYYVPETGLRRMVFEYSGGQLKLMFGVRKDALPMTLVKRNSTSDEDEH